MRDFRTVFPVSARALTLPVHHVKVFNLHIEIEIDNRLLSIAQLPRKAVLQPEVGQTFS
jgi:hypothetical protein